VLGPTLAVELADLDAFSVLGREHRARTIRQRWEPMNELSYLVPIALPEGDALADDEEPVDIDALADDDVFVDVELPEGPIATANKPVEANTPAVVQEVIEGPRQSAL
jgi:hypothetical protein